MSGAEVEGPDEGGATGDAGGAAHEGVPCVTFRLGPVWLGVRLEHVAEFCELGEVVAVPLAPRHVRGVFNHRGTAMPLFDLAHFLGLESSQGPVALVICAAGMRVAVACDKVGAVDDRLGGRRVDALEIADVALQSFAEGALVDEARHVVLLDMPRVLEAARVRVGAPS